MKFVIAVDSFKGSLSAKEVTGAVHEALTETLVDAEVVGIPISDGGEGMADVLIEGLGGRYHNVNVVDALMRPMPLRLGSIEGCAVIEVASVIGLSMLDESERNPMTTTSYGVGLLIRAALDLGYKRIMIGLGGTSTNDAGLGMMQALGMRCYNAQGMVMRDGITGADLVNVAHFDLSQLRHKFDGVELLIACDVQNPLYGNSGAAHIYAQQKGASREDIATLDSGLRRVNNVWKRCCGLSVGSLRGAGAAGGIGAAFAALLGCKLHSGIDMVLDMIKFDEKIIDADWVITGEGSIDSQSLMGKVMSGVLVRTLRNNIPLLAIGGKVINKRSIIKAGVKEVLEVSSRAISDEEAMRPEVAISSIKIALKSWVEQWNCDVDL
ncbi:MAG: glycerate kinase [bacterium]